MAQTRWAIDLLSFRVLSQCILRKSDGWQHRLQRALVLNEVTETTILFVANRRLASSSGVGISLNIFHDVRMILLASSMRALPQARDHGRATCLNTLGNILTARGRHGPAHHNSRRTADGG
jgi:hypothetical protein